MPPLPELGTKPPAPSPSRDTPAADRPSTQQRFYDPQAVSRTRALLAQAKVPTPPIAVGFDDMGLGARLTGAVDASRVENAQNQYDDALRSERMQALGIADVDGVVDDQPAVKDMTQRLTRSEYDALTPLQRSAVDYNTILARAVKRDRKNQDTYHPNADQRAEYGRSIAEMFGEGRGSVMFAPETLAVLEQIGYKDNGGGDLDDFLSLNAAISAEDLADLQPTRGHVAESHGAEGDKTVLYRQLSQGTQAMEASIARSRDLLQSALVTSALPRNTRVGLLGGMPKAPAVGVGYGNTELDKQFQRTFETLADKGSKYDPQQILTAANSYFTPEAFQEFLKYADARSGNAVQYGLDLGQTEGVKYRTPEEFRKLLNLGGGRG